LAILKKSIKTLTEKIVGESMKWIAMNPDKTYELLKSYKHYKNTKDGGVL
jgi:hypothetical protein